MESKSESVFQAISSNITVINDFPKPGIMFRNINTLINRVPNLFFESIKQMSLLVKQNLIEKNIKIDCIVGVESRGFLFVELAKYLGCKFTMGRKSGKLPKAKSIEYSKEYGIDKLEIEENTIEKNSNVLIVDDLIATGGTLSAICELVKSMGSNPVGAIGLIKLEGLNLNENLLGLDIPIMGLLKYPFDSSSNLLDEKLNEHLNTLNTLKNTNDDKYYQKKYYPLEIPTSLDTCDTIVFYYPTLESLAIKYVQNQLSIPQSNSKIRLGTILWNKFPDFQPNIQFESDLENKKVIFFMSLYDSSFLFEQLSMIKILPRQFIKSLDIYICYYSTGTMERVDKEGVLATADTMAGIISNCMEPCKEGIPTIHIYDIHALPNRFYFDSNKVHIKLHTGINLLKQKINFDSVIVFPDEGSYKRFKIYFSDWKMLVCSKTREGDNRLIRIKDQINFPKNFTFGENFGENFGKNHDVIIIDDLVQSGNTLIECKKALEKMGFSKISAYSTHSVFPSESWKKIIGVGFDKFYTTNSVPEITDKLIEFPQPNPFVVLNLFSDCGKILPSHKLIGSSRFIPHRKINIFVGSHNKQKLKACWVACVKIFGTFMIDVCGINVDSQIPEQPIGRYQTNLGSTNRMKNLIWYLNKNNIHWDFCFCYENGIIGIHQIDSSANELEIIAEEHIEKSVFYDVCFIKFASKYENIIAEEYHSDSLYLDQMSQTIIPKFVIYDVINSNQTKTIGKIIQDLLGMPSESFHCHYNEKKLSRTQIMEILTRDYLGNYLRTTKHNFFL